MTCHVRFFIPANAASTSAGQVDLMIEGTVSHFGVSIVNPVYSFRGNNTVLVFSDANRRVNCNYISSGFTVREWTFTATSTKVNSFASTFDSYVSSWTYNSTKKCTTCAMTSAFASFIPGDVNGFGTVAVFAKALGSNTLYNYFDDPDHTMYLAYLPASLKPYGAATGQWAAMSEGNTL